MSSVTLFCGHIATPNDGPDGLGISVIIPSVAPDGDWLEFSYIPAKEYHYVCAKCAERYARVSDCGYDCTECGGATQNCRETLLKKVWELQNIIVSEGEKWAQHHVNPEKQQYWRKFAAKGRDAE